MSKDTDKILFMGSSMPRLYQQLLAGVASYEALGNRILKQIKTAHAFRQIEQVRELARILINVPIREYQLIAQYYLVWCKCREYQYPAETLERIIEQTQTYKTKALFSRAAIEGYKGDTASELYFYNEALKGSPTISEFIEASKAIAVVKAKEGFHRSAMKDLESLIPIIKHAEPMACSDVLNSYAVELAEAGRLEEAENVSRLTIASPFAPYYPEWQSTFAEIRSKRKRRSIIAISLPQEQSKAEPEPKPERKPQQPASIVSFPPLKEAPEPKKPDKLSPRELYELTASEKRELILTAIRTSPMRDDDYDRIIDIAGLLESGPADEILDLEDEAVLDNIIGIWANQIEPEELAAVMSALRDCGDSLRQRNIFDRIIRIAFEESALCNLTEDEWRRKFERRLPKT